MLSSFIFFASAALHLISADPGYATDLKIWMDDVLSMDKCSQDMAEQ